MTAAHPAAARYAHAVAQFKTIGWTVDQWEDQHQLFAGECPPGDPRVAYWLRHPPLRFVTPITPTMVMDLHDRHGTRTAQVLAGVAVGASERFCCAFLGPRLRAPEGKSTVVGWLFACDLDLSERQATGWAATDYLWRTAREGEDDASGQKTAALISQWVDRFGPDAWLFVLAGITLEEADALAAAGTVITVEQMRVMAALNGHTLPAGI